MSEDEGAEGGAQTGTRFEADPLRYWSARDDMLYYQVVRILGAGLAEGAGSVLDVGSRASPYLEWFPEVPLRTSLDLEAPYRAEGIRSITSDFLVWQPDQPYDLVLCLQVLEHVPDAAGFARRLLAAGKVILISVPYRWRAGQNKHHVHDPVTLDKIRAWFGRDPNFSYVVREPSNGFERLICVFEEGDRRWSSLAQRAGKRGFVPDAGSLPPEARARPLTGRESLAALSAALRRRVRTSLRRARR